MQCKAWKLFRADNEHLRCLLLSWRKKSGWDCSPYGPILFRLVCIFLCNRLRFNRNMPSAERSLVSRNLCFYFKKRPLYGLWASFLIKWTEVAPSSQDLAKKILFHINSWRKKPISTKPLKFRSSNVQTQVAMKQKIDAYI